MSLGWCGITKNITAINAIFMLNGVLKSKTPICHLGYSLIAKGNICEIKESQPEVIGKLS